LVANCLLPEPIAHPLSQIPPNERANLQIRSNHKWPERIVFDTTRPDRSFEPSIPRPEDLAAMEQRGSPGALSRPAPVATNDKTSAIIAKPSPQTVHISGTVKAD
jgi:hypothetical protein